MNTGEKYKTYSINNVNELLALMQIYLNEWTHRDNLLWKQCFTFFFASFVVIVLPFVDIYNNELTSYIPNVIFPIVGIMVSMVYLYVVNESAARLTAIGESYQKLIDMLPEEYRRIRIEELNIKKSLRMAYVVPNIMFLGLILLGTIILFITLI